MSFLKIKAVSCDICKDKISLYQPWYSIRVEGHLGSTKAKELKNPMSLCPNCFQAYKNFLVEHEVQENHKKNYNDLIQQHGK